MSIRHRHSNLVKPSSLKISVLKKKILRGKIYELGRTEE
jgi:hypothetical protein